MELSLIRYGDINRIELSYGFQVMVMNLNHIKLNELVIFL